MEPRCGPSWGLIGWATTNSTKLVAPLWGAERMLGTNPIAVAFPAGEEPPVVIDFATSAAAYGKLEIARRKGEPIPPGWAIDRDGNPATRPEQMIEGGALLLPLDRSRPELAASIVKCLRNNGFTVSNGSGWESFDALGFYSRLVEDLARRGL